jgi:RNA polymerase sigma-70 factor (family 1)
MPKHTLHIEEQLMETFRKGSPEAFEEIFKTYWHCLYSIARSKVQSREEAEEIVQGIFATLWEKRASLLITNLSYYLVTALRNKIIDEVRLKITQKKYWDYYKNFIPQQSNVTDDLVVYDDLSEAFERAVNRLSEKSREVFRLSRLEGRSKKEIGELLHLSEKAIEYHLTKSLKELRVQLKDYSSTG